MQPDSPFHGLEGLKHMATAIVPAIYDPSLADRNIEVETEAAYRMAKRLARRVFPPRSAPGRASRWLPRVCSRA